MNITLESIQLTSDDLLEYSASLSSSQELYSPTAPAEPIALFGWRDRWWLNKKPAEQVAIHYWFFDSTDKANTAANEGRTRLTSRTLLKLGGHVTTYQPVSLNETNLGDSVWQSGANWLFVRDTIVILVAEIGGLITAETTLAIANKVLQKIEKELSSNHNQ